MGKKYNPENVLLKGQRFIESKKEEKNKSQPEENIAENLNWRRQKAEDKELFEILLLSADDDSDKFIDLPDMPPLENDEEEVKEGKRLKILAPKKL